MRLFSNLVKNTHHELSLHFTRCTVLTPLPLNFATSRMEYPLRANLLLPYIRLSSVLSFLQSLPCVRVFHLSRYIKRLTLRLYIVLHLLIYLILIKQINILLSFCRHFFVNLHKDIRIGKYLYIHS